MGNKIEGYVKKKLKKVVDTFGCEKDTTIPKHYLRAFTKMGLESPIITVPKRHGNLMTASGKNGKCHSNVSLLVKRYGGKKLRGYIINDEGYGLMCYFHSVWITPEGKAVCVTATSNKSGKITFIPFDVVNRNGQSSQQHNYYARDLWIPINYKQKFIKGCAVGDDGCLKNTHLPIMEFANTIDEDDVIVPFERVKSGCLIYEDSFVLSCSATLGSFEIPSKYTGELLIGEKCVSPTKEEWDEWNDTPPRNCVGAIKRDNSYFQKKHEMTKKFMESTGGEVLKNWIENYPPNSKQVA